VSGSILPFEGRRHAEAQRLLPWLLTGRLEDDEHAWLEAHVSGCGDCRNELEQLRVLRDACAQAEGAQADASVAIFAEARPGDAPQYGLGKLGRPDTHRLGFRARHTLVGLSGRPIKLI